MPWTRKPPRLCQGALHLCVCMCWGMPSMLLQAVYNSVLAFISNPCRVSWSKGAEILMPYEVFPWHSHSPTCVHGLQYFQEYDGAFQSPLSTFHSPVFLLRIFWVSLLLIQVGIAPSGSCDIKQLPLIFFNRCSKDRAVLTEWVLSQIK